MATKKRNKETMGNRKKKENNKEKKGRGVQEEEVEE